MPFKVHHEVCAHIFWIIFENEVKNVYLQLKIVFLPTTLDILRLNENMFS